MGKQKYSRVASNDEDEPLPVRQSGQSAIGVLWQTAATDPPIAKQFRPKKRGDELWVEMAAKMPSESGASWSPRSGISMSSSARAATSVG